MFIILNRMAWILSAGIGCAMYAIDDDLWFLSLIAIILVKFVLLGEGFLKKNILTYSSKIENMVLSYLKSGAPQGSPPSGLSQVPEEEEVREDLPRWDEIPISSEKTTSAFPSEPSLETQSVHSHPIAEPYHQEPQTPKEPSAISVFLKNFFSENLMAKIGGILLALGIIFLMSLVYSYVGNTMKIIIGFVIGFGVYTIGNLLYQKGYKNEGLILLGSGILINYIVILGGRFLIGESGFLSASLTFGLLVLNSIFSTLTSLVYQGKHMLLFSIFLAYITPYLVGSSGSEWSDVLLLGYNLMLGVGTFSLVLSRHSPVEQKGVLLYFLVILGNILITLTPISHESWTFVGKMIVFCALNALAFYGAYRSNLSKHIVYFLTLGYFFFFCDWQMMSSTVFLGLDTTIVSLFALGGLLLSGVFFLTIIGAEFLFLLLFAPLLLILGMLFTGDLVGGIFILPLVLMVYMVTFVLFLGGLVTNVMRVVFFGILGVFVSLVGIHFRMIEVDTPTFVSLALSSLGVIAMTFWWSKKDDLGHLYPVGALIGALMLLPIIQIQGSFALASAGLIGVYFCATMGLGFFNKRLLEQSPQALILGNIVGVMMVSLHLYRFGIEYFPGVSLGFAFAGLAIIYFLAGYGVFVRCISQKERNQPSENFLLTLLGIALSLFSYSLALLFASTPLVIALCWIGEAVVVSYFAKRFPSMKLLGAVMILTLIGVVKYYGLLFDQHITSYGEVVALGILILQLMGVVYFTKDLVYQERYFLHVMHILGMLGVYMGLTQIFSFYDYWLWYTLVFFLILKVGYALLQEKIMSIVYLVALGVMFWAHLITHGFFVDWQNYIFSTLTLLLGVVWYLSTKDLYKNPFAYLNFVYFFLITSLYLSDATGNDFSLTIYWGALALLGIQWGISQGYQKIRFIGLVILFLTLGKIAFYDIWNQVDQAWLRIVALLFVGGMMVSISMLYTKNKLSLRDDLFFTPRKPSTQDLLAQVLRRKNSLSKTAHSLELQFADQRKFTLVSKELCSLAIAITEVLGKNEFAPRELEDFYQQLLLKYSPSLSDADRKKLQDLIKDFVQVGGCVMIKE